MMKRLLIFSLVLTAFSVQAFSLSLSSFDDFSLENPFFSGSWENGGTPQFIQEEGFISIAPVSGGNPRDDGLFFVLPESSDFSTFGFVSITAREEAGNETLAFNFYLEDSQGEIVSLPFIVSSFAGSFTTRTAALSAQNIDYSDIVLWGITTGFSPLSDFRVSFDEIAVIPEPGSCLLLGTGLLAFLCRYIRRR